MLKLFKKSIPLGILISGAIATSAIAGSYTLRVGSGHPAAPTAYVTGMKKTLVPNIKKRVKAETGHKIKIIEAYAGKIAKVHETLEDVEKGLLDYEEKVSRYWPEFGCNGKEDITVGMLLSHQAGICGSATNNVKDYYNQKIMSEELAAMEPIWEPGTASGYHSMTYGWLTSELIIRVTGKTLGAFYQEEIGKPNNIDFFIGLPKSEEDRVVEMVPFPKEENQPQATTEINDAKKATARGPNLINLQNSRDWRAAEIPSANGQGCASGLAKLYSLVVTNNSELKILNEDTINKMTKERITNRDLVLDVVTQWGAGFIMNMHKVIYGPVKESFGHSGWGGSCAFGDPKNNLGISYVMNQMKNNFAADGRSLELINKTYECLNKE